MSSSNARLFALVPCAGVGARSGAALPKQYVSLAGQPMVAHTLRALSALAELAAILVVLSPEDAQFETCVPAFAGPDRWVARCGGATRAATVSAGLEALILKGALPQDWVLVHDAARCLVRPRWIRRLIEACRDDAAGGLLALPVADTLKQQNPQPLGDASTQAAPAPAVARVQDTVDRRGKWLAQTPQMFRLGLLQQALRAAGDAATDEASAIEALGLSPRLVEGSLENFKLTYAADFEIAERLLRFREGE